MNSRHGSGDDRPPIVIDLFTGAPAEFESLEHARQFLTERVRAINERPQPDLGNLTPHQLFQLLYGDWVERGALRVNRELTLSELQPSTLLHDARVILGYVAERGPVKLTQRGNLARTAVTDLVALMRAPFNESDDADARRFAPRLLNEGDVQMLEILRVVLGFAKLTVRRKGLRASRLGRELLAEQRAGELFALLVITIFRTLDLRALGRTDDHAGLQRTVPYSLFMLGRHAREWTSTERLAEVAWHPDAKDPPRPIDLHYDLRYFAFWHRVIRPLHWAGVVESREVGKAVNRRWEHRLTPLFDRFFSFRFEAAGA